MRTSKLVTVVHPDSKTRILLRSVLEGHGCTVATDHSCTDLLSGDPGLRPHLILLDRSLVQENGMGVLSELNQKWPETEMVFLPETLLADGIPQLLSNIDRLLNMRTTREILAV